MLSIGSIVETWTGLVNVVTVVAIVSIGKATWASSGGVGVGVGVGGGGIVAVAVTVPVAVAVGVNVELAVAVAIGVGLGEDVCPGVGVEAGPGLLATKLSMAFPVVPKPQSEFAYRIAARPGLVIELSLLEILSTLSMKAFLALLRISNLMW